MFLCSKNKKVSALKINGDFITPSFSKLSAISLKPLPCFMLTRRFLPKPDGTEKIECATREITNKTAPASIASFFIFKSSSVIFNKGHENKAGKLFFMKRPVRLFYKKPN